MDAQGAYSIYVHNGSHKVLIQFTFILYKAKQKLFRKKNPIVSLVVKTRNYYREGIRYAVKVNCKVYPNFFEHFDASRNDSAHPH